MPITDFEVKSFDGKMLKCRKWTPDATPKARILFIHGYSEFMGAYDDFFPHVSKAGYEVIFYDQRGHGKTAVTPKEYGVSNEKSIAGDLETMVDYVSKDFTGKLILWGFSMGGAICLNYMVLGKQKERFDLYIALGPYIDTHQDTKKGLNGIKLMLVPYIAKVYPSYTDSVSMTPELVTNNKDKWPLYKQQPERHLRTTVEFMNDAVVRGKRLLDPAFLRNIVDKPLFLSQGSADKVCDPAATKAFFDLAKLSDKTYDVEEDLPHEVLHCNDADAEEYWRRVNSWITSHLE